VSPIVDPIVRQPLSVVFSGRRSLTEVERLLVARLKQRLAGDCPEDGTERDARARRERAGAPA
jgi:hypothetical protein